MTARQSLSKGSLDKNEKIEGVPYMEIQNPFLNRGEYKSTYFKLYHYKVKYLQWIIENNIHPDSFFLTISKVVSIKLPKRSSVILWYHTKVIGGTQC